MVLTVALAALLAQAPQTTNLPASHARAAAHRHVHRVETRVATPHEKSLAVDLHPMTDEERKVYPGRERFDKTEWYESLFKSMKIVLLPEHVDEWNNGGLDMS